MRTSAKSGARVPVRPIQQSGAQALLTPNATEEQQVLELQRSVGNRAVSELLGAQALLRRRVAKEQLLLQLQRSVGNRAVSRLLGVQPKLTVGPANDSYEREADQVGARVVQPLRAVDGGGESLAPRDAGRTDGAEVSAGSGSTGGRQLLDAGLGRSMADRMGADFSGVQVHTDAESDQMCRSVQARAFTTGQDLYFSERAYDPGTRAGQELIAHELTHVVQQGGTQVRRQVAPGEIDISSTSGGQMQRKFGFEIELPVLLTEEADTQVTSLADGSDIDMQDVPRDPGLGGHETHLMDFHDSYVNLDHSRTLDKLFELDLNQYATDQGLNPNETASLKAESRDLMQAASPRHPLSA